MKEPTRAQADAFERHLCQHFGASVLDKGSAAHMQIIGDALQIAHDLGAHLPDRQTFLERYATTLGLWIYIPASFTPAQRIQVVAHECMHVKQFRKGGLKLPPGVQNAWLYLMHNEARVRYEAEAYAASLEVNAVRGAGLPPSLDALAWPLETGYALDPQSVQLGANLLASVATSLAGGARGVTEAGQLAGDWLRANGLASP